MDKASDNFKVTKLLDGFNNEQEQVERFVKLYYWLEAFPLKEEIDTDTYTASDLGSYSGYVAGAVKQFNYVLKQKDLFNDDFFNKVENHLRSIEYESDKDHSYELVGFLKEEYDINFYDFMRSPKDSSFKERYLVRPVLFDPHFEIPSDVVCDDDEPEESTTTPTTSTVGDESETPTITPSATDKEEPDTKTTSKEKPEEPVNEDKKEDKEDKEDKTTTPGEPVNKEDSPVKPGNSIINPKPVQQGFTPVQSTKPVNYSPGVNSTVEPINDEETISEGVKADTGSPVTSITSKIFSIFN